MLFSQHWILIEILFFLEYNSQLCMCTMNWIRLTRSTFWMTVPQHMQVCITDFKTKLQGIIMIDAFLGYSILPFDEHFVCKDAETSGTSQVDLLWPRSKYTSFMVPGISFCILVHGMTVAFGSCNDKIKKYILHCASTCVALSPLLLFPLYSM